MQSLLERSLIVHDAGHYILLTCDKHAQHICLESLHVDHELLLELLILLVEDC